jgi:hypothetical protein
MLKSPVDRGPCFRMMMVVNVCGISQLIMQFYAGISSLINRKEDWTFIEMVRFLFVSSKKGRD